MIAAIFPGQGSQAVGMGRELARDFAVARNVFAEVDEALGEPLTRLMFEGPEADLTRTANTQPALMAASMAMLRVLETETEFRLARDAAFVAGHSLGEYTALAAAGSLEIGTAARLLRLRGNAMQDAVPVGEGAMAALLGVDEVKARELIEAAGNGEVCDIANDNGGGQIVISGTAAAVSRAIALAKERGVKRAVLLQVSAPFHCGLMGPAARAMAEALRPVRLGIPAVPLVANRLARPVSDPEAIRAALVDQVCGTVRWRESVAFMADAGVTQFLEIGSGKVLCGLIKRIAPETSATPLGTPDDIKGWTSAAAH